MAAAQQPQSGGGDNSLGPLWITIAIIVVGAVIWYYGHDYIVAGVLKIRLFEIYIISFFNSGLNDLAANIRATPSTAYGNVTFRELTDVSMQVGYYLRFPLAAILLVMALFLYFRDPILNLRKTYNIQRLIDQEKDQWPQIQPVATLDLVKTDIRKGPWAMSLTPMQFAQQNKLLEEKYVISADKESSQEPRLTAVVMRAEAQRAFTLQLGRYWQGPENLPIYAQAIFAMLAARVEGNQEGANKLIYQIAQSATHTGALNFTGTAELLNRHKGNKFIQKLSEKHAFELTFMSSLLQLARNDGVFPTSDFLWLKPVDRRLWYTLNSVGRRTPFVEVGGVYAHWIAELKLGRRIRVPMVEAAVDGLEAVTKEVIYHRDEEEQ